MSPNLADQARSLFQTAQARLPGPVFADFVGLVQQFRSSASASSSSSSSVYGHGQREATWDNIRHKAANLLAANYQDIYALFEQLLQATQMQQQR